MIGGEVEEDGLILGKIQALLLHRITAATFRHFGRRRTTLRSMAPYWSSRGYQNIMPERVITMTGGVIKHIKSGRRRTREIRKKKRQGARWKQKTNRPRTCPLAAVGSQSKDFNSQETKWTSVGEPGRADNTPGPACPCSHLSQTLTHTQIKAETSLLQIQHSNLVGAALPCY